MGEDDMGERYKDLTQHGEHQGRDLEEEVSTSVRTQPAAYAPEDEAASAPRHLQLLHHEEKDVYRFRVSESEPEAVSEEGFKEIGRRSDPDSGGLTERLPDRPRFLVLENTRTGEVLYDRDRSLSNWMQDGEYDQVSLFATEEAASDYVARRSD